MTNTALLKYYIDKKELTQTQIADMLNISFACFNNKVNNKRQFTTIEINKLCNILGLNLQQKDDVFFCDLCTQ
mgnify:CR=1 FL=1